MEPGLRRMLAEIRGEVDLAYKVFTDARELRELLLNDLATLLTERFSGVGHSERPYMFRRRLPHSWAGTTTSMRWSRFWKPWAAA
jgi:hypothetical protein